MKYTFLLLFTWATSIVLNAQVLLPVKQNGKWGFINNAGTLKVPAIYDALNIYNEYGYAVVQKKDKLGLINSSGKEQLPIIYDEINVLNQHFLEVLMQHKWMLINDLENVLLNSYEDLMLLDAALLGYQNNKKWGVIDKQGNIIIPAKFDSLQYEKEYIITYQANKLGLYSKKGQIILDNIATKIKKINEDIILFQVNQRWGGINKTGNLLFSPLYQYAVFNFPYLLELENEDHIATYSLLDKQFTSISKLEGDKIEPFSTDLFLLRKGNYCGLMDKKGILLLPVIYDEILSFSPQILRYKQNNKWGIINYQENKIYNLLFDYIAPLQQQVSIIKNENKYGLLNDTGSLLLQPDYEKIQIEGNKIKAYQGEIVEVFLLQSNGTLIDANTNIENHQTFTITPRKISTEIEDQKRQLKQHEWFYDATSKKWGLRSLNDGTTHVTPKFDYIEIKKN